MRLQHHRRRFPEYPSSNANISKPIQVFGDTLQSMDGNKYWTESQKEGLKQLFYHYDENYKLIAKQMKIIFQPSHFKAGTCKKMLIQLGIDLQDSAPPTHQEVLYTYNFVKKAVIDVRKDIWPALMADLPRRGLEWTQGQYFFTLWNIIKLLSEIFVQNQSLHQLYAVRSRHLVKKIWYMMLYLSEYEHPVFYDSTGVVAQIIEGCRTLERCVNLFITQKLYDADPQDVDQFKQRIKDELRVTREEVIIGLEVLLLMDTMVRISAGAQPFVKFDGEPYDIHRRFAEIPPRQPYTHQYHSYNQYQYRGSDPLYGPQQGHVVLDAAQAQTIMDSDAMLFIVAISSRVDQVVGRENKRYHVD